MSGFTLPTDPSETKGFLRIEKYTVQIKNFKNESLFAYPELFTVTFKSDVQANKADFYMDIYKDLDGSENRVPVAFSCKLHDKTYLLCVASNSLTLKECDVPDKVPSGASEFIFYQRDFSDKYRTLESSVKKGFFLAFNKEDLSLILKHYPEDNPDIKAAFTLVTRSIYKPGGDPVPYFVLNSIQDLLIPHPEECIATFESDGLEEEKNAIFHLEKYGDSSKSDTGIPVVFRCEVDSIKYLLSAESDSVVLKEGDFPTEILTTTSEYIFYWKHFFDEPSSYRFESSLDQKNCLAWSKDDPKKQLILKTYQENVIDETMKFDLLSEQENTSALRSKVRNWKQSISK